jgi:hypothetical protein
MRRLVYCRSKGQAFTNLFDNDTYGARAYPRALADAIHFQVSARLKSFLVPPMAAGANCRRRTMYSRADEPQLVTHAGSFRGRSSRVLAQLGLD